MNAPVFEPIATAIAMARGIVPSVDELNAMGDGDAFATNAVIPAALVHILCTEVENAYAEIARLEAALMVATTPRGRA